MSKKLKISEALQFRKTMFFPIYLVNGEEIKFEKFLEKRNFGNNIFFATIKMKIKGIKEKIEKLFPGQN